MLNLSDKLVEAKVPGADRPLKSTFKDGRLATKEAFNFCKDLCESKKIDPPSYMAFKWHVKHGEYLSGQLVPNPFGKVPERIYAIEPEEVISFVDKLVVEGDKLRVISETTGGGVIRRSSHPGIDRAPKPPPEPIPEGAPPQRLSRQEAYDYLLKKAPGGCPLTKTTFGHYLTYKVIDSEMEGKRRFVMTDSIDVFLELFSTGIYANHLDYEIGITLRTGQLSMAEAYSYYVSVDPEPITKGTFRSLVAAGIILAIREESRPKAKTIGFKEKEILAFLALRHRLAHPLVTAKTRAPRKELEPEVEEPFDQEEIEPDQTFPIDRAFLRFQEMAPDMMPAGIILPEFRSLVRKEKIKSVLIEGVEHVSFGEVETYFRENPQEEEEDWSSTGDDSEEEVVAADPEPEESFRGKVSLSLADYPSQEALNSVLETLTEQGFEVEVKP